MAHDQRQRQLRAIRNDRHLARFVVEGRATGKLLGTGSYGSVEEIEVNGLICAGKKIHDALIDAANAGVENVTTKYVQECQLMSDLRHPNITQFLGVCFIPNCQLPVLLMEKLDSNLDVLIETVPNIPLALKRSMLENISKGLLYLHKHTPQIIHRDLTATNVLLNSYCTAKITDLGNSRIVNLQPGQLARTLSRLPGTLVYMPPEALSASSRYGPSLDVFSFGHLALFTLLQVFPGDLLEHNYADPDSPGRLVGRTEVERRQLYFDQLDGNVQLAQLVQLIKTCLHNDPSHRPSAERLVTELERMKADIEGLYGKLATVDAVRQVMTAMALKEKNEEKLDELAAKEEEIQQLHQQMEAANERYQAELYQKDEEVQRKNTQVEQIQVENARVRTDLQQKELEIRARDAQIQQLNTQLREKDDRMREKDDRLRQREAQLQQNEEVIQQKNADISTLQREVQRLQESLKLMEKTAPLKAPPSELKLDWRRGKDLPFGMADYPSMVVLKGKVYIGGGFTPDDVDGSKVIVYDPVKDFWSTLPPYIYRSFSMAVVNNQLVLVGGFNIIKSWSITSTNKLGLWNEQCWTHPLPPMTTACYRPTVVTYKDKWLVVIGGDSGLQILTGVEILDTSSKQWFHCIPMPQKLGCSHTQAATIGSMCYLLGGYMRGSSKFKRVVGVCLDDLVPQLQAVSPASGNSPPSPSPFQILPDTPLKFSTSLALNGTLLLIGGLMEDEPQNTVYNYAYHPESKEWVKAGEIPVGRAKCSCIVLPSGEIMVTGSSNSINHVAQRLHLATVS